MRRRVFVSYDHSEDAHYRYLLRAWNAHPSFAFEFDQRSPKVPINSVEAHVIQSTLTRMMKQSDYLLVIVGHKSHTSDWMAWEIARAKQYDVRLRLAAVKIHQSYISPAGMLGVGTSWGRSFTQENVIAALNQAAVLY